MSPTDPEGTSSRASAPGAGPWPSRPEPSEKGRGEPVRRSPAAGRDAPATPARPRVDCFFPMETRIQGSHAPLLCLDSLRAACARRVSCDQTNNEKSSNNKTKKRPTQGPGFLPGECCTAAGVSAPTGGRGHAVALALASLSCQQRGRRRPSPEPVQCGLVEPVLESGKQPAVNGLTLGFRLHSLGTETHRAARRPGEGRGPTGEQGHLHDLPQ